MRDILFFDSMLTPKIITLVYWLLLVAVVISGLGMMFSGGIGSFLMGIFTMLAGAVGARIWCELLIVLFKINENMKKVADK
ncbi:MAG: DUF4282 domain-containing protein [Gammaproteobacteria bacterium]|nr:DUF4282 domain-containing protein [Gammaproteobacteria bacterium]